MSITSELFDRWKAAKKHTSDRAALAALGVSHGAAVHWRAGKNAEVHIIEKMAADLGDDPMRMVAAAMREQARGEDAKTWGRLAKRLGAAAAVVLAVALPYRAQADAGMQAEEAMTVCIMRSVRRWMQHRAAMLTAAFGFGGNRPRAVLLPL